jgi:hypothetical protein
VTEARRTASLAGMFAVALSLECASCRSANDDSDLLPPADFAPPPIKPLQPNPKGEDRLGFGRGFYPPDVLGDGRTWHWMARSGEVRLRSDGSQHRLRLLAGVPLQFLDGNPTIQITLDGRALDKFSATTKRFRREYEIPADRTRAQPSVLLRLETSLVAHVPGDSRELGVSIEELDWEVVD